MSVPFRKRILCDLLVGLLALIGAYLVGGTAAHAHAGLVSAAPTEGAVLDAAPPRFELTFSEPVSPLRVTLVGPDGASRDLPGATLTGNTLLVPAPSDVAEGSHVLSWRVVSADGHPVAGSIVFSVGTASAATSNALSQTDPGVRGLVWLSRLLLYAGLFLGVGGAAAGFLVARPAGRTRRWIRIALVIGLLAAPVALVAQGLDALGFPLAAIPQTAVWKAGAGTSYAATILVAVVALALGVFSTWVSHRAISAVLSAIALLAAALAFAASGHASTADPQLLMRPAVFLHTLSVALWIGALVPLAAVLRGEHVAATIRLRRFSRLIPLVVVPLLLSGAILALVQVGSLSALWNAAYGRVLLAKLSLLALLFAVAAYNRWRVTGPVLLGSGSAMVSMRRSIVAELVLSGMILSTVALWRFTPPPRVEAAIAAEPATAHLAGRTVMADVSLEPGRAGPLTAKAALSTLDGRPVAPKAVTFVFEQAANGIGPLKREGRNAGDDFWRADATLPVAGSWTVNLEVLIDDFTLERLETNVIVRP